MAKTEFELMLEESLGAADQKVAVGSKLKGEILSIGKEQTFVSVGPGQDGQLPTLELLDDKKQNPFKVGDQIEVVVIKVREGEIRLRRKDTKSAADIESLEDAFDMELPIEGKVLEVVKGGYRIQIQTKTAFCPISQLTLRPDAEQQAHIGKKYEFIITQFEKSGRNIVVSRRRLLELQSAENEGQFLNTHQVGELVDGTITRLEAFGAFVEIASGVEGLVHISEISWSRIQHPSELLSVGTPVKVKILKMEEGDRLKISLSLKQGGGESDPWTTVAEKFPIDSIHEGLVVKKEAFGLFVSLAPAVQALLPRSKWKDSTDSSQYENKKKGDKIKVKVIQIQQDEHRMTLGLPEEKLDEDWREHSSQTGAKNNFGSMGDNMADLFKNFKPKK
jgi:small subunit ribosomal protein S1